MARPAMNPAAMSDIAALGFTAAKGLYDIAELIGAAGREVRVCADEIDSFAKALSRVKVELDRPAGAATASADVRSLIKDVVRICEWVLTPFDKLQKTLAPLLVYFCDNPGKLRQFGLRVRRVFTSKSKLLFYRDTLRGQHQILNTAFEVLIFQTVRDLSAQNIQLLRLSLESSTAASHSSQGDTFHGSRSFDARRIREGPYRQMSEHDSSLDEVDDAMSEVSESDSATLAASVYDDLVLVQQSPDSMTSEEIRQFDVAAEIDLGVETAQTNMEIWVDTNSIRRKILRIAAEALRDGQHRQLGAASPTIFPLIPAERHDVTGSNIAEGRDSGLPTSAGGNLGDDRSAVPPESITLEDVDGEPYILPYATARNWDTFTSLLKEVCAQRLDIPTADGRGTVLSAIETEQFDLLTDDCSRILHSVWEQVLRPGWHVRLRFRGWAKEFNEVGLRNA